MGLLNWWESRQEREINDEALVQAVLREAKKTLRFLSAVQAWLGDVTVADIERELSEAKRLREWALGLENARVREEYLRWADHAVRCANEARRELETHAIGRQQEKFNSRLNDVFSRVDSVRQSIPKPPT